MKKEWTGPLEKIDEYRYRIPKSYKSGMRTSGIIYTDEKLLKSICQDQALDQVANVAFLPGIVGSSLAMPDIHWGYGFCIGGVAAFDVEKGIISPGGVGFDINCGVRVLRTNLKEEDIKEKIEDLGWALFREIPCGVGSTGRIRVSDSEWEEVLTKGTQWAVKKGYGVSEDIEHTEEEGAMPGADPDKVSFRAKERGRKQLGTLGSGNHFLEIQVVEEIFDDEAARLFGIEKGSITMMIHCGSRGFGHQVCTDQLVSMGRAIEKYGLNLPDRQLACAPVNSKEGKDYFGAMACAANYAWANRQCIMHWVREIFEKVLGRSPRDLGMDLIYDVAHNIAKFEEYEVEGKKVKLCIHRKGATRAFGPNHPQIPKEYKSIGQPVLIPGDMGRNSYILVGTKKAEEESWGSTCHGAGRVMSRHAAIRLTRGRNIKEELRNRGIIVHERGRHTLQEEVSEAYKDAVSYT
ncbi:MAG TPA: RtcB family protein, partial [bacterium]|nr:RtcB family protein [bacterium]